MTRFRFALLLWACAGFSAGALAEGRVTVTVGAGKGEQQAVQWFNMLDRNGDGQLKRSEVQWAFRLDRRLEKQFDEADANHDGIVTEAEIRALAARRKAEREARRAGKAPAAASTSQAPMSRM